MGRMIDAHNAYLARWAAEHPNIVQPTIPARADEEAFAQVVWADKGKTVLQHGGRFWKGTVFCPVYRLSDGRVVEETRGAQGAFRLPVYAIFNNEADWRAYEAPMTIKEHFEQW